MFEADQTDLNLSEADDPGCLLSRPAPGSGSKGGVAGASQGRFPVNGGITGYVATTGETVNITDAYNDPRFLIDFSTIVPKYTMKEKIPFSAF